MTSDAGVARRASPERSAAFLIFRVRGDAPKAAPPSPVPPVEVYVDDVRQTALKAVSEAVGDVAAQATSGATAKPVDDTARVTTQSPNQAFNEGKIQRLRILFSLTDEILPGGTSDLRQSYSLEVTAEHMDALV